MPEAKSKCGKCGAEILAATAERTGGLCMPCKQRRLVTLSDAEAQAELEAAAATLETRAKLLRVATRRIPPEEWLTLSPHLQTIIPQWYRDLLSRYSLYGLALECRDLRDSVRCFSFAGPADYNATLEEGTSELELPKVGAVPIGYESNGNLWVVESPFSAASEIYLYDHSGWRGCSPGNDDGFVFAVSRFSLLLCSMGLSEGSYSDSPTGITSLIWHEDRGPNNAAS